MSSKGKKATAQDAQVLIQLYDLRREATMRKARDFVIGQFWPSSYKEFESVMNSFGSEQNAYCRQVLTYWDMAAAMVLEGYLKGGTPSAPITVGRNRLTPREREIVQLLAEGKSTKEVAVALGLSVKTAETHRSNIMRKLQLHSVSDLVLYAVRNNIVHVVQAGIE